MISIDSMPLQRGVFWENETGTPSIAEEEFFDVDGGYCHQYTPINNAGRDIQLVAEGSDSGSRGCFTRALLDHIKYLERTQAVVQFIYGDITLQVRVPSNPLNTTPLRKMYGHLPGDIYYGTITLKEV